MKAYRVNKNRKLGIERGEKERIRMADPTCVRWKPR